MQIRLITFQAFIVIGLVILPASNLLAQFNARPELKKKHFPDCMQQSDLSLDRLTGNVKIAVKEYYDRQYISDTVQGPLVLVMTNTTQYDTSGRWTEQSDEFGADQKQFGGGGRTTKKLFNAKGDIIKMIHYNADSTDYREAEYIYRPNGTLMEIRTHLYLFGLAEKPAEDEVEHFDLLGNPIELEQQGLKTIYKYEDTCNCIETIQRLKASGKETTMLEKYDNNCRLIELNDNRIEASKTTYKYDTQNKLIEEKTMTDKNFTLTKYKYDDRGNQIQMTSYSKGKFMLLSWDKDGKPLPPVDGPETSQNETSTMSYTYDSHGNWTEADVMINGKLNNKMVRKIIYY